MLDDVNVIVARSLTGGDVTLAFVTLCSITVMHHCCRASLLASITVVCHHFILHHFVLHHCVFYKFESSITLRFPPSLHVPITSSNNTIPVPTYINTPISPLQPPSFFHTNKPHNRHFQQCLIRTPVVVQSAHQPTSPRSLLSCSIATTTSPLTTPPTKKQAVSEATSRPTFRTA